MDAELSHLIAESGAIALKDHLRLRKRIRGAVSRGELMRVLPGVYAPDFTVPSRIAAVHLKDRDAVIGGAAAASVSWWEEAKVSRVLALTDRQLAPAKGFRFHRGIPHDDLIIHRGPLRLVHPALSVIQMLPELGPDAIDTALRLRAITLPDLRGAIELAPNIPGNTEARQWIEDSRDQPWSAFERDVHRLLREAGIDGFVTNLRVQLDDRVAFLDIAFPRLLLNIELDGWQHHNSHRSFVEDRERDVMLTRRGWRVLRFAHGSADTVVAAVQAMMTQLGQ